MSFEQIFVAAGGSMTGGWEAVSVTAALNEAARSFSIDVTEISPLSGSAFSTWPFPPGTPVTVLASGSLLVTGYVNTYSPSGDANSHSVVIAGRGRGQDYADCSAVHPTGRFDNKKVEAIAQELDVYGVGITAECDTGKPVPWFQIRQGASPHQELLRLCRQRKLTLKGSASGGIAITKGGTGNHSGGLVQGINIKRMSASISDNERFSDYTVKGQSSLGTTEKQLRPKGQAKDGGVRRYRPKVIIDQADTDEERCTNRAMWEAKRAAGFSVRADIVVPSFRDMGGALWEPGWTVFVDAPWLKLRQSMLIERVEFRQSNQAGTESTLSLVDPKAYDGQGGGGSGSGSEWSMP